MVERLISPRKGDEVICWVIALIIHSLLLLWQTNPYSNQLRNPIVSIDYIVEDVITPALVSRPEKKEETFTERIKSFFGKPKTIEENKEKDLLAGKIDSQLKPISIDKEKLEPTKKLLSKQGAVSNFGFKGKETSNPELTMTEEQIDIASKYAQNISKEKAMKLESKSFTVASNDLPFKVDRGGDVSSVADTTFIPLGKTSKNISTTKEMVIPPKSSAKQSKNFSSLGTTFGEGKGEGGLSSGSGRFGEDIGGSEGGTLSEGGGEGGSAQSSSSGGQNKTGGGKYGGIFQTSGGSGKGGWSSINEEVEKEEVLAKKNKEEKSIRQTESKGRPSFEIMGPLANRGIINKVIPEYPEWAKRQGIDAAVSLHFVVLSDGNVKRTIYVQRTSGYPKLDNLVIEALGKWTFAALEKEFYGKEQWGVITFYFYLK